jgi:hypothetical protein
MTDKELKWNKDTLAWTERIGGVAVGDVRLAAGERDRSLFAQTLVLLREAEDLLSTEEEKIAFRASMQTITDHKGVPYTLSVTELRELLVQYGLNYRTLWLAANASIIESP